MEDDHSLLAHLVPKLTPQVEDVATDALAYILNQSARCREALGSLMSDDGHQLQPLYRASTQVTVPALAPEQHAQVKHPLYRASTQVTPPHWRLDLVAYDADDSMRLIIESKFWAALLSGQASGYVKHLAADKAGATLLFVAPEVRRETLWVKIRAQFDKAPNLSLGSDRAVGPLKVADVSDSQRTDAKWRVALTSWYALLEHLEPVDSSMTANIRQLRSLANAQDDEAFAPLHTEDFNPAIPRRHLDFCRLVDDVVNTGEHEGWISVKGFKATAQRDGYLRFFRFSADDGGRMSKEIALYFSASRWVKSGTAPIWLRFSHAPEQKALAAQTEIEYQKDPGGRTWVPLRLLTGVEYSDVFDDVVAQVKHVREVVLQSAGSAMSAESAAAEADRELSEDDDAGALGRTVAPDASPG